MTTVDELAQVIRQADGQHSLGAGALAEAILAKLPHLAARHPVGEPVAEAIEQLADDVESCVSDACGYLASDSGWDDYGIYRDDAAARYRALPDRIRALAAPPAQAVDLGHLPRYSKSYSEGIYLDGAGDWVRFADVLALIDSQAVQS